MVERGAAPGDDREDATILHADLDAFYASVEQRRDPSLLGKPVIVGGGVVLAASYEARRFGVHSAMNGRRAQRLCPHAIWVPPSMASYGEASRQVMDIFGTFTPLVEPLSPDEAFLDVAGARRLFGSPASIAEQLRARVRDEAQLPLSVGVARTKFLAKVASGEAKPDGMLVVDPDGELDFLHPLPVEKLWGVGPKTTERLHSRGVYTVGDLAHLPGESLSDLVGRAIGLHLHALGWNDDPRVVDPGRRDKSVGSQQALGRGVDSIEDADRILLRLADRVARRMRKADLWGSTVVCKLRFRDQQAVTRSRSLSAPTQSTSTLYGVACELVHRVLLAEVQRDSEHDLVDEPHATGGHREVLRERGLTLLGISVHQVGTPDSTQLELPMRGFGHGEGAHGGTSVDRAELDLAVDRVRERFGREAVGPAALISQPDPLAPSWAELEDDPP
jgi:DNA polymerase IV